jgi:hypothetical protein
MTPLTSPLSCCSQGDDYRKLVCFLSCYTTSTTVSSGAFIEALTRTLVNSPTTPSDAMDMYRQIMGIDAADTLHPQNIWEEFAEGQELDTYTGFSVIMLYCTPEVLRAVVKHLGGDELLAAYDAFPEYSGGISPECMSKLHRILMAMGKSDDKNGRPELRFDNLRDALVHNAPGLPAQARDRLRGHPEGQMQRQGSFVEAMHIINALFCFPTDNDVRDFIFHCVRVL